MGNAEMADLVQMKIPKTYDEQILNLQEKHGLIIADCAKAKEILRIPLIIVPNPATSSPPTRISRKSAIQAHCLHAK